MPLSLGLGLRPKSMYGVGLRPNPTHFVGPTNDPANLFFFFPEVGLGPACVTWSLA